MAIWVSDLESTIFTMIKAKFPAKLKNKYPNIYFTISNRTDTEPKFPTVYIHEMPGSEQGQDLAGTSINAVLAAYQIDILTNTSQREAKEVMSAVMEIMKGMAFTVISMPEFQNTDEVYGSTARFRRMIGANDIL